MEYSFYYLENKIILTDDKNKCLPTIMLDKYQQIKELYNDFFTSNPQNIHVIFCSEIKKCWDLICEDFFVIEAAGGCVLNEKGELLVILRHEKWDLPKGKVEDSEIVEDAAIREVEEETGVKLLKIIKTLPSTYHLYKLNSKRVIKKTYWFEMQLINNTEFVPQLEEGITEVKWIKPQYLDEVLKNTYSSIVPLFQRYMKK